MAQTYQKATFGGGCFWGVEAAFRKLEGVIDAPVGYAGGHTDNPGYRSVCNGDTGHAEVCEVTFDPSVISYEDLLTIFFDIHDPTMLNHQGPDHGTQYRSVIFTHSDEQAEAAKAKIASLHAAAAFSGPIVTEVSPAPTFWRAEEYHQRYAEKQGKESCGWHGYYAQLKKTGAG